MKFLSLLVGAVLAVPMVGLGQECVDYGAQAVMCGTVPGDPTGVELMDVMDAGILLAVTDDWRMLIYALDDPEQPVFLDEYSLGVDYGDLSCAQDIVYLCGAVDAGMRILRVGADGSVEDLGNLYDSPCTVTGLDVDEDHLGVCMSDSWSLWDCSDPAVPTLMAKVADGRAHADISLYGDRAMTWESVGGLNLYDLSTPEPAWLNSAFEGYSYSGDLDHSWNTRLGVVLFDGTAYLLTSTGYGWTEDFFYHVSNTYISVRLLDLSSTGEMTDVGAMSVAQSHGLNLFAPRPAITRVGDRALETNRTSRIFVAEGSSSLISEMGVVSTAPDCPEALAGTGDVIYGAHATGIVIYRLPEEGVDGCPVSTSVYPDCSMGSSTYYYLEGIAAGDGFVALALSSRYSDGMDTMYSYWIDIYDPDVSLDDPVFTHASYARDPAWLGNVLFFVSDGVRALQSSLFEGDRQIHQIVDGDITALQPLVSDLLAVASDKGITIYDVADLGAPVSVAVIDLTAADLAYDGSRMLALQADAITVIDVADPSSPQVLGSASVGGGDRMNILEDGRVLITYGSNTSTNPHPPFIVDYNDPAFPFVAESWDIANVGCFNATLGGLTYIVGEGVHLLSGDGSSYIGCLGSQTSIMGAVAFGDHLYSVSPDGLLEMPQDCDSTVPVWLARCGLDLAGEYPVLVWSLGDDSGDADFIVEATSGVRTWTVPVRSLGGGLFEARDTSAAGLQADVTYRLYAEQDGARTLLAEQIYTSSSTPSAVRLVSIAPNPFNPRTRVAFTLDRPRDVSLKVYDTAGRLVRTLSTGVRSAGTHTVEWDGLDDTGAAAASGAYFFRLESESGAESRKALLVR